jgi:hypothetical protein
MARRIFLLSPASCAGKRAGWLIREEAAFPLARSLRGAEGAPIGEVFSFVSGLYFRGKLAYAKSFGRSSGPLPATLVITPTRGLMPPESRVTADDLREFASVSIGLEEARYLRPFERDARRLAAALSPGDEVVLLGSVATGKYVDPLLAFLGPRLLFPSAFPGRGDMSRGGLLLRSAREARELAYAPAASATRHGPRPPKLVALARAASGRIGR